jgi:hypothetical protein
LQRLHLPVRFGDLRNQGSASVLPDGNIFKPKILIWLSFGRPCNGRPFGLFYGHLVSFKVNWNILRQNFASDIVLI